MWTAEVSPILKTLSRRTKRTWENDSKKWICRQRVSIQNSFFHHKRITCTCCEKNSNVPCRQTRGGCKHGERCSENRTLSQRSNHKHSTETRTQTFRVLTPRTITPTSLVAGKGRCLGASVFFLWIHCALIASVRRMRRLDWIDGWGDSVVCYFVLYRSGIDSLAWLWSSLSWFRLQAAPAEICRVRRFCLRNFFSDRRKKRKLGSAGNG